MPLNSGIGEGVTLTIAREGDDGPMPYDQLGDLQSRVALGYQLWTKRVFHKTCRVEVL